MPPAETRKSATPTALITGATGGIGGAIARLFAENGVRVLATGRNPDKAAAFGAELAGATGTECLGAELDVTKQGTLEALKGTAAEFGPIDWLINNAGVAETGPALSQDNQPLLRRMMEVNFYGPLRLFDILAPGMIERGHGRVVQIASSAALQGYPYVSAYAATKHALLGWSRSAALECAPKGLGISTICPHYVDTPLTDRSIESMKEKTGRSDEDLRAFVAGQNPSGVIVSPEEVAEVALGLARGDRAGVIVEMPGGAAVTLDEGVALAGVEVGGGN